MKKEENLKRVIVDLKKLNDEILTLLVDKFPDGYGDRDIISFKNKDGKLIDAVEVKTHDTKYLVKISEGLEVRMEAFESDDDDDFIDDDLVLPDDIDEDL